MTNTTQEEFIATLEQELERHADASIAAQQKAYLKDQFEAFGLKSPQRREVQKPFLAKAHLPPKAEAIAIVKALWNKPQREFHYIAQELLEKYLKQFETADIDLLEWLIVHQSWWDTIDFIAPRLVGGYMKMYPDERHACIDKWLASGNIWLQRSCVLFQLKYKKDLDTDFLTYVIGQLLGSNEFFINKAIGWILRDYSRIDPDWVSDFVHHTEGLSALSRREALRLMKSG
jgi:3-methyladenine DNA glycosylase AlkD